MLLLTALLLLVPFIPGLHNIFEGLDFVIRRARRRLPQRALNTPERHSRLHVSSRPERPNGMPQLESSMWFRVERSSGCLMPRLRSDGGTIRAQTRTGSVNRRVASLIGAAISVALAGCGSTGGLPRTVNAPGPSVSVRVGSSSPYSLYTHCGVLSATINGQVFFARPSTYRRPGRSA